MIFLSGNVLVERDLTFDDIKPRLLGHWGTCPGLTLVYAHLNYLVRKNDVDMIYVVGVRMFYGLYSNILMKCSSSYLQFHSGELNG